MRQLAHAQVVDDEERDRGEIREVRLAGAVEGRLGDVLEERVGLTVDDAIALLDGGAADGLREVALARAGRPEEERVFALLDEARRGQIVDQCAVHLLIEIKVEAVEGAVGIAKAGLLVPAFTEPVLAL